MLKLLRLIFKADIDIRKMPETVAGDNTILTYCHYKSRFQRNLPQFIKFLSKYFANMKFIHNFAAIRTKVMNDSMTYMLQQQAQQRNLNDLQVRLSVSTAAPVRR